MPQLSSEGRRAVEDVARRMGFSPDAVTSMLFSIVAGRGGMAQFNHPEFGGSGQWMSGGAIMISDMFNNVLKARVGALCNELSALIPDEHGIAAEGSIPITKPGKAGGTECQIVKPLGARDVRAVELVAARSRFPLQRRGPE